mmetsp:Transcript_11617/g.27435  ORF Transcript_11617/g.27435 Transcript_11617/m.27435 type:complete len:295 (+) Transcript_11617:405-1289(+)
MMVHACLFLAAELPLPLYEALLAAFSESKVARIFSSAGSTNTTPFGADPPQLLAPLPKAVPGLRVAPASVAIAKALLSHTNSGASWVPALAAPLPPAGVIARRPPSYPLNRTLSNRDPVMPAFISSCVFIVPVCFSPLRCARMVEGPQPMTLARPAAEDMRNLTPFGSSTMIVVPKRNEKWLPKVSLMSASVNAAIVAVSLASPKAMLNPCRTILNSSNTTPSIQCMGWEMQMFWRKAPMLRPRSPAAVVKMDAWKKLWVPTPMVSMRLRPDVVLAAPFTAKGKRRAMTSQWTR